MVEVCALLQTRFTLTPWSPHARVVCPLENGTPCWDGCIAVVFSKDVVWVDKVVCIVDQRVNGRKSGGQEEESGRPQGHG